MTPVDESQKGTRIWLFTGAALLILLILAAGVIFYQSQEKQARETVTGELVSISTLKADEIARWREDRLHDARTLSASGFFIEGVDDYLSSPDPESEEKILERFREVNESVHYHNVLLVDPGGTIRISLDPNTTTLAPEALTALKESLQTGEAFMTDLHLLPGTSHPHIDMVAPLLVESDGKEEPVGAVILSIDPERFLYPLVQSWPVPSRSAETLLVERQGDHVLFLNDLRFQQHTALNLTIPLSETEFPAVMAVLGETGAFEGTDYRGVEVISVLEPVRGTPWHIVAKVDRGEAFSGWAAQSLLIFSLAAGILASVLVVTGWAWQRRQKHYYRSLYRTEAGRAREEQVNRERLDALVHISEMEAASEKEIADYVLDAACHLTGSSLAFIGSMSPDETVFHLAAWSSSVMEECAVAGVPLHFPIAEAGIWAEAVRTKKPVILNDYPAPHPAKKGFPAGHVQITRFAAVPVLDGERVVMVSAVANKEADYTETDIDQMILLMQGFWTHLQRHAARDALERKRTDLEAAYEEITATQEELQANYEELAKSQIALRESERKYRDLYEYAQVGLFETSLEHATVIACNQRFCELFGFPSASEAIGKDVLALYVDPSEREEIGRILKEKGAIEYHVVRFRNQSTGRLFWGQFSALYNRERDIIEGSIVDITAQKAAEARLRETNEYLDNLINYANAPIIVWDPGFRITRFNNAFERLTGCTSDTVTGKPVSVLFPERTRERSMEYLHQAMAGERWETVEIPILRRDGSERVVLWNSATLYSEDGKTVIATIAQGQDITGRKAAEQALKESEERYREFFTTSRDSVFITTPEGKWLDFNDTSLEMFGYPTRDELMALPVPQLYADPLERDEFLAVIAREGFVKEHPMRLRRKDGTVIDTLITAVPLRDRKNAQKAFMGTIRDVTFRKAAEKALRRSEDTFRHISGLITDFAYSCRKSPGGAFCIDWLTGAVETITGYTQGEIHILTCWRPLVIEEDLPVFDQNVVGLLPGESSRSEIRIRHRDGRIVWLASFAECVIDPEDPTFHRLYGGCRDISARKEADRRQNALVRELEQKNAELERFTYTVSHDLRSPLITIRGFAELIDEDAEKGDLPRLHDDLKRIISAADRMQDLLNDLLELSRIGRLVNPSEKVRLDIIAQEAADLLAGPIGNAGVEVDISPDLPVVNVDRTRMREVFTNLIENAIKFTRGQEHPLIQIKMREEGGEKIFFVQDNGIGIEPRYLSKIFGLFEKLDGRSEGTGIGLAIVKRIIEFHGGRIWAESEGPGKGTTICFTLPVLDEGAA